MVAVLGLTVLALPHWQLVTEVPCPPTRNVMYASLAGNGSIIYATLTGVYRRDGRTQKETLLGKGAVWPQSDNGWAMMSLARPMGRRYEIDTYRVSDGKLLSTVPGNEWRRVGSVISTDLYSDDNKVTSHLYDVRTGQELKSPVGGKVLWEGRKYRLVAGPRPHDTGLKGPTRFYRLWRFMAGTFEPAGFVDVGEFERDPSEIIGNPDAGPFAVQFSYIGVGVESFTYDIVDSNLKRMPTAPPNVWDVSPLGVLGGSDLGYPPPADKPRFPDVAAYGFDGKLLWQNPRAQGAIWAGPYAVVRGERHWTLMDRRGRKVGILKPPRDQELLSNGDLHFFRDRKSGRLSAWRLVGP